MRLDIFDKKTAYKDAMLGNGLYDLSPLAIDATTKEDIYGNYELNIDLSLAGNVPTELYEMIQVDNIIKVQDENGEQLFRIASTDKGLDNIEIYCRHITISDSLNLWLGDVRPENKDAMSALQWIAQRTVPECKLLLTSDIKTVASATYIRKNLHEALFEDDNAFIKRWGGEIKRTGYQLAIKSKLGLDKTEAIKIKEALNLTEFNAKSNIDEVSTVIYPVGFDGITADRVVSDYVNNYSMEFPVEIKYEDVKVKKQPEPGQEPTEQDREGFDTLEQAQAELQRRAREEFTKNHIDQIQFECDINYLDLSKFEEYKDLSALQTTELGDYVSVRVDTFDLDIKARIVARTYDTLRGVRIDNTISTDGELKKPESIKDIIKELVDKIDISNKFEDLGPYIDGMIQQGFKKGYIVVEKNAIYAVDTLPKEKAKNVIVLNNGGLGFSGTGIGGPFTYGFTIDGKLNADMITTGAMSGQYIKAGTIEANKLTVSAKKEIASQFGKTDQFINLQTDVTGLKSTVGEIKKSNEEQNAKISQIEQTAEGIKTTVANVKKTVQGQNAKISQIEQTADGIKTTVADVEKTVQGQTTKISQIEQTTNGISTKVESAVKKATSAEKKVSQLQQTTEDFKFSIEHRGTANLLRTANGINNEITRAWTYAQYNNNTPPRVTIIDTGSNWAYPDATVKTFQLQTGYNDALTRGEIGIIQRDIEITVGKKYTFSCWLAGHRAADCYVYIRGTSNNVDRLVGSWSGTPNTGGPSAGSWTRIEIPFTAERDTIRVEIGMRNRTAGDPYLWFAKPMLNTGEIAADFTNSEKEITSGITKIDKNGVRCDFEDGTYAEMGRDGFKYKHPSWTHPYQYVTKVLKVAKKRNGYWHKFYLGEEFKNKQIDRDFKLTHYIGAVDCNAYVATGQYGGALRTSFTEIRSWNPYEASIEARCCIQKITLKTEVMFGWDQATTDTNRGGIIGESAGDIIIIAQM